MGTGARARLGALRIRLGWRLSRMRDHRWSRDLRLQRAAANSPASFERWLTRGPSARWSGFPTPWCAKEGLRPGTPAKVAVALHVFYEELLDELVERMASIPVAFDLYVTNASNRELTIDRRRLPMMGHLLILDCPNRGRDIYPLAALVNAEVLADYLLVLKIHTKRSAWRASHELSGDGDSWRDSLLSSLLPSRQAVEGLISGMVEHPEIGIVTAPGSVLDQAAWGDNEPIAAELLRRLELPLPESFEFAAGSMYWCRGFVLQGLRGLNLSDEDFEDEVGQVNFTTAHALERVIGILADEAGLKVVDVNEVPVAQNPDAWRSLEPRAERPRRARVVPFYLPQFHAVDQNDAWWGPGFTEWTNVTAAKPAFLGHWQPKLPRELGFYDLQDPQVLARQEELAAAAGVAGFMFYHYWFSGTRILEAPLQARAARVGGLPFCIMWANENWTRRWDGQADDVLLGQDYSGVPAADFVDSVLGDLAHPDYLKVDGRPLLAIYRPAQIPDVLDVVREWRARCMSAGIGEIHVVAVDVPGSFDGLEGDARDSGFDAVMGFAPHNFPWKWLDPSRLSTRATFAGNIFSYQALVESAVDRLNRREGGVTYPGVMTGFDNTARRQRNPDLWYGANPYTFRRWLAAAVESMVGRPVEERIIFVNAWNEWAEGALLEPSDKFGLSYLQAVRDVVG